MDNHDKQDISNVNWVRSDTRNEITNTNIGQESKQDNKERKTWRWIALALILVIGGLYFGNLTGYSIFGDTVATVNGVAITSEQLDKDYELFFLISGYPEQFRNIITKEIYLNQTTVQILLAQKAKDSGFEITDNEVDEVLSEAILSGGISFSEFETRIAQKKFNIADVKEYLKKQLLVNKFIEKEIEGAIDISDDEINKFYNENIKNFDLPEQVRAAHILICHSESLGCSDKITKEQATSKIIDLKKEIDNGANFSTLASEFSVDGSRSRGGDLGFFVKSIDNDGTMPSMVPEFEKASFNLKIGEVSEPVETVYGIHLIKVLDHQNKGIKTLEQVKENIKETLLDEKRKLELNSIINELLSKNDIKIR